MINYELAKKLKKEGFASKELGRLLGFSEDEKISAIQSASLSALIDACGDEFEALMFEPERKKWYARNNDYTICTEELTYEEAVANLWLALNKK